MHFSNLAKIFRSKFVNWKKAAIELKSGENLIKLAAEKYLSSTSNAPHDFNGNSLDFTQLHITDCNNNNGTSAGLASPVRVTRKWFLFKKAYLVNCLKIL